MNLSLFRKALHCGPTASPLIRTKCLSAIEGFDELMPARQDWELWIRICEKFKVEAVHQALWLYHLHGNEHIGGNIHKRVLAHERIMTKNTDYLKTNTEDYWDFLTELSLIYLAAGEKGKIIVTLRKAFKLKPLLTMKYLLKIFLKAMLKSMLKEKTPKLFYALKYIKQKLKGDNIK